jgi:hypothetical protein
MYKSALSLRHLKIRGYNAGDLVYAALDAFDVFSLSA